MVMDADVKEMEDGGTSDFFYKDMRWTPVKVDRVLHDGTEVELGGMVLYRAQNAGTHQRLHHVDHANRKPGCGDHRQRERQRRVQTAV